MNFCICRHNASSASSSRLPAAACLAFSAFLAAASLFASGFFFRENHLFLGGDAVGRDVGDAAGCGMGSGGGSDFGSLAYIFHAVDAGGVATGNFVPFSLLNLKSLLIIFFVFLKNLPIPLPEETIPLPTEPIPLTTAVSFK